MASRRPREVEADALAGVREAFLRLEAAISTADPARCHGWVGPQVESELLAGLERLAAQNRRRVHGSFEILDASLRDDAPGAGIVVRIHAHSSIYEIAEDGTITGVPELMLWDQDVTAEPAGGGREARWVITALGELRVLGPVTGPAGTPIPPETSRVWEERIRRWEQEADESIGGRPTFMPAPYYM